MATVKMKLAPTEMMGTLYFMEEANALAAIRAALREGLYTESALFEVNSDSMDAAEEAFDLTNNPYRQDEREEKYGRGRSLSVGDVVVVGEEQWLCMSSGWKEV